MRGQNVQYVTQLYLNGAIHTHTHTRHSELSSAKVKVSLLAELLPERTDKPKND